MSESACSLGDYYAERVAESEAVYREPERQADLARLRQLLPPLVAGKRVLEVAAGTGYWTQLLATAAAAITATDPNAETIAIAAQREYGPAAVSLRTADPYELADGDYDVVFCAFWWSGADLPRFLAALRPGTKLVLLAERGGAGRDERMASLQSTAAGLERTELDTYLLATCVRRDPG
jgi:protein-L-isoaspartate O-methyltransferase